MVQARQTSRPWSRIPRSLAAILFGLQALLWGGGSILEAKVTADSLAQVAHIEDETSTACPPIHSHVDCLICRTFASGALTTRPSDLLPPLARVAGVVERPAAIGVPDGSCGPLGSRAPPLSPDRPIV